jgi:putative heme-binding domain-containing protein
VTTKDCKEHIGLIIEENGNNITLRTGSATELILIKDITKRASTNRSLMPDGLETVLKPQDVADVIAWIRLAK